MYWPTSVLAGIALYDHVIRCDHRVQVRRRRAARVSRRSVITTAVLVPVTAITAVA